jgi:Tol biopolymer transport system component
VLPIPRGKILQPVLSPDGTKLAFTRAAGGGADVWIHDFATAVTTRASPSLEYDEMPTWSPDGRRLAHQTTDGGRSVSRIVTIDGSAPARIVRGDGRSDQPKFSADGRFLMVWTIGPRSSADLAAIALDDTREQHISIALTTDPANEGTPDASPDGQWMAFASDRTGRTEVVVARVSESGATLRLDSEWVPVSADGGISPHWRGDGRELLYLAPDGHLMTVGVTRIGATIQLGKPTALFRLPTDASGGFAASVAPNKDHTRFVVVEAPRADRQTVRVLTNWETRLAAR